MIILKISEKGHYIEFPGMSPFRTPAEVNISHISINLVVSNLQSQGIKKFKIISDTKGKETVLTNNDFTVDNRSPKKRKIDTYEKRIDQLETLIGKLIRHQTVEPDSNTEQINNKLNNIEKLLEKQSTKVVQFTKKKQTKKIKKQKGPVIEELGETFIPSINVDAFEMKGNGTKIKIEQDNSNLDESADLLSRIMQVDD